MSMHALQTFCYPTGPLLNQLPPICITLDTHTGETHPEETHTGETNTGETNTGGTHTGERDS